MSSSPVTPTRGPLFLGWIAALAAVLCFVVWDARVRSRHVLQVSGSNEVSVNTPRMDPHSPTGYEQGVRSIVLPDRSMDGYHWIMQAQAAMAEGSWRVRHASYDHSPEGREVHWAGPFRWWLSSLAEVDHTLTGRPLGISLERAALLAGPVLMVLLLLGVTPLLAYRFSAAAAGIFAIGSVALLPFYVDFVAGYADHHGLVNICGLLSVLTLLSHDGGYASARRWTIAGALAGGMGLWISAPTQIPVLIGLGLGGVALCWLGRGPATANLWTSHPKLFRIWGATGAAASLAAYLIEYFPDHFGMRLEINHPLYALAWLGGGEALCRLASFLRSNSREERSRHLTAGAFAAGAVLLVPVLLTLTREITFKVSDAFLWRLHNDFISEFQSLPRFLQVSEYRWDAIAACLPLLLLIPALWLAFRRATTSEDKASLALSLAPALFVLPLTLNQVRWWSLEYAMLVSVIAVSLRVLRRDPAFSKRVFLTCATVCALTLIPGLVAAVQNTLRHSEMEVEDIHALAERDLAHWLRQRAGAEKVVVAASPTLTTGMIFHGGLAGVGTLYWENEDGLKTAAAFYAAPDEAEAHRIALRCGITHIVVVSWDGFEGVYTRLARGLPSKGSMPTDTFIVSLLTSPLPPAWLRSIHYSLPKIPALEGQELRIYEVTAEQTPDEVLLHTAEYLIERGMTKAVIPMAPVLGEYSDKLTICTMLARIAALQQDSNAFSKTLGQVIDKLPQSSDLSLEDHVRLVTVLAMAERFDLANEQLMQCLRKATPERLRKLSASTLATLLSMTESSGTPWPEPSQREFAMTLLPPKQEN